MIKASSEPNFNIKPPDIEWILPESPDPPPKRLIKKDISKEFLKGMMWAFLIIIVLHIVLAYILFI